MVSEDSVELRSKPLNGDSTLLIEAIGSKFDCNAIELLKGVTEQKELAFDVHARALHRTPIPSGANFQSANVRYDVKIASHADGAPGLRIQHREWQPFPGSL
jgi:hypothetical protein